MVYPEVADEANRGKKASPTGRTEVGRCCSVGAGGSGLACSTFLFSLEGSVLPCNVGSSDDGMVPRESVRSKKLSGLSANVEVFQGDL